MDLLSRAQVAQECLDRLRVWLEDRRRECLRRLSADSPAELVALQVEWRLLSKLEGELLGEVAMGKLAETDNPDRGPDRR